ncbi:TPA: HNH endonuclease [Citrobacter freundii]|nr:HNH endonuclease [Citrobacter freundii]
MIPAPAETVDHIKPKAHGGTDDLSNLESICSGCHKAKTARERLNRN